MDQELRDIVVLVQAKRYDEARQPLNAYLKVHPDAAYGWYMQSFVAVTPSEKNKAIQQALKFAPENANIVQRAAKLGASQSRSSGKRRLVLLGVFLLFIVAAVGIILFQSNPQPTEEMPTLAAFGVTENALQTLAQTPTLNTTISPDFTLEPTVQTLTPIPATETAVPSLTHTLVPLTSTPVSASPTLILTLPAYDTLAPEATLAQPVILTRQSSLPTLPPNQPVATAVPSPTRPSPTPFTPIPSPTVIISGSVPFGTEGNIGVGQVRIVQASRPGLTAIQQIGGTVPNTPAGDDWVLVEILMKCSVPDNCATSLGSPSLSGSFGIVYDMPAGVNLEPFFNADAYYSGQVWGFAAFLIPKTEGKLSLLLKQNGQNFAFALQ